MSEWPPTASDEVLIDAEPALTGAVPSDVAPSKNSTVPPGDPEPGEVTVTVAVSATLVPNEDGFGALLSAVAVLAWFTVWLCAEDVLPLKLASPEYTAVSEWPPTASAEVLIEAELPLTGELPSDVAPSKNSTVPPGVPEPGGITDTVAERLTLSPTTDGFGEVSRAVEVPAAFTVCVWTGDVLPP